MSKIIVDGNEAAARIAYKVSEVAAIFPITPSTPMGEIADALSASKEPNIWGVVPSITEMQSEGGASGALHGAIQTGALGTTFTASQGLLLMLPNMYKIAGELTPTVIHVASRSIATQSLSIFGDHSDVMAARMTGFALLSASSVQEAQDMALIAHASTLESRIPFLHFFDGFRTSHELNSIDIIEEQHIKKMIDDDFVIAHRQRRLSPDNPFIRGTSQNPDVYFQARETVNQYYLDTPNIVAKNMNKLAKLTGRQYQLINYHGSQNASNIIVLMGSASATVKETINSLHKLPEYKDKLGLLTIHLYRPFPAQHLIDALPKTVQKIAVLDRTKEPGSLGEPLYLDVVTAISDARTDSKNSCVLDPRIIGGRYGLSSKEFTPAMVKGIFDELAKECPKNNFTIGIKDDVTYTSLSYDANFILKKEDVTNAIFYGLGSDGTVSANKNSIKIIGEQQGWYVQGYFVYDSKKAGSKTISHLRFGKTPINLPYLIRRADFVACHKFDFIQQFNVLKHAHDNAIFLLNSPYDADETWQHLPIELQTKIIQKNIVLYVINANKIAREIGLKKRINTIMQTCFFSLIGVLDKQEAIIKIKKALQKSYAHKGLEVLNLNCLAVDYALTGLHEVMIPTSVDSNAIAMPDIIAKQAPEFVKKVLGPMLIDEGDSLPVSMLPPDGTYPSGTTKWEKKNISDLVAVWSPDECIQCGKCTIACPHSVIRNKSVLEADLQDAPVDFPSLKIMSRGYGGDRYTLQVYLEDCTGCNLCVAICPVKGKKAINLEEKAPILDREQKNITFFETLKNNDRTLLNTKLVPSIQYMQPLFEFSSACSGCGETPYLRILSQLYGDRLLIANATGCSSIYGGNLPTTPWAINDEGKGPAWSNSLFEDNAEFGLGFYLTEKLNNKQALSLLAEIQNEIDDDALVNSIIRGVNKKSETDVLMQQYRIKKLKIILKELKSSKAKLLYSLVDFLATHSIWIVGGDGWAYDIGFGGLDHVMASGANVNILVMDTQAYSNTGGQASKATPLAAIAKFASSGKSVANKDLGKMIMCYEHVYVAQIASEANPRQALLAIQEAEAYNGPSLIIAYSQCIAHGIKIEDGLQIQEDAVASGFWPLYRRNPSLSLEGKNPFKLDSRKPKKTFIEFANNELRFSNLKKSNPQEFKKLMDLAQEEIDKRWQYYSNM